MVSRQGQPRPTSVPQRVKIQLLSSLIADLQKIRWLSVQKLPCFCNTAKTAKIFLLGGVGCVVGGVARQSQKPRSRDRFSKRLDAQILACALERSFLDAMYLATFLFDLLGEVGPVG
jgi:hypothetical protein